MFALIIKKESGVVSSPSSQPLFHNTMHFTESTANCITASASPANDETSVTVSARSLPSSPKAAKEEETSALTNNCVSHSLSHEMSHSGHPGHSGGSTAQCFRAEEIARIIGNIAIALYEGSPRRYGLKYQPGHSQRVLSSTAESSNLLSRQANDTRSTCENDEEEELQDIDTALVDVNCDENVKSPSSIPLPFSALISVTDSNYDTIVDLSSPRNEKEKVDCPQDATDTPQSNLASAHNDASRESTEADSREDKVVANDGVERSQSSEDPENQLIFLHERVHQHGFEKLRSLPVAMSTQLTCGSMGSKQSGSESRQQQAMPQASQSQQSLPCFKSIAPCEGTCKEDELLATSGKVEESRNFTLSPETTECDSNEIESEYSLSSGCKLTHMPILQDGLSSGMPSSDSEYEDVECNNSHSSLSGSVRKQLMFHNASNASKRVCGENVQCHYPQSTSKNNAVKQITDSANFPPSDHSSCLNHSSSPYNSHYNRERQSKHHSGESDVLYHEGE